MPSEKHYVIYCAIIFFTVIFSGNVHSSGGLCASETAQFLDPKSGYDLVSIDEQVTAAALGEIVESARLASRGLALSLRGDGAYAQFESIVASDARIFSNYPRICVLVAGVNLSGRDIAKTFGMIGPSLSAVILDGVTLEGGLSLKSIVEPASTRLILKDLPSPFKSIELGSGILAVAVENCEFLVGSLSKVGKPLAALTLINSRVSRLGAIGAGESPPHAAKSLNLIDMKIDVPTMRGLISSSIEKIRMTRLRFDNGMGPVFGEFTELSLDTLMISNCDSIKDSEMTSGLPRRVRYLSIVGSAITDASIPRILKIEGLEWLSLSNSLVTNSGAALLINSGRIKDLGLDATKIDDGLSALINQGGGGGINLASTRLSESGILGLISRGKFNVVNLGKMKVSQQFLSVARSHVSDIKIIAEMK